MEFDEFLNIDEFEYEEAFPQDREMKEWMDSIDRDYSEELTQVDVDENFEIYYNHTELDDLDEDLE